MPTSGTAIPEPTPPSGTHEVGGGGGMLSSPLQGAVMGSLGTGGSLGSPPAILRRPFGAKGGRHLTDRPFRVWLRPLWLARGTLGPLSQRCPEFALMETPKFW